MNLVVVVGKTYSDFHGLPDKHDLGSLSNRCLELIYSGGHVAWSLL